MQARSTSLTPVRALGLWVAYVLVFSLFGGLGAGFMALAYDLVARSFSDLLYAVVFGATGFVAVQLARRVVES